MLTQEQEKVKLLQGILRDVDVFASEFNKQITSIVNAHKQNGGHLEYAYVEHFHKELMGLSGLFYYLLQSQVNEKYAFFAVRGSLEILLYLEYVLRLAKKDSKLVLNLLSRDLAQSAAAINEAAPVDDSHQIHTTLRDIDTVNKILNTDFDLDKVKSNSKAFPDIKSLCNQSELNIKNSQGADIYHIYALYSESNHLRLGNQHAITDETDILTVWALEYFIEIYIKFYDQILATGIFDAEHRDKLDTLKQRVGLSW